MLYQFDVGKHSAAQIVKSFWEIDDHPRRVREFANELFEGSISRRSEIDSIIQKHAKNWRLNRMAVVDRNILRLAVYEFLSDAETPGTVIINEALEIAKKYSTADSAQFVNGILDSVKEELAGNANEEGV